ncbi:MAG: Zn-dependent hydrolase [Candidatus Kapabacteria bacterium]|nr:Zn-dependent hydrolase [Candidatus Kapabacteria bacterium]
MLRSLLIFIACTGLFLSCGKKLETNPNTKMNNQNPPLEERIAAYSPCKINADLSHLSARQKKMVSILAEAGHLADKIFWKQTSPDALKLKDSLSLLTDEKGKNQYKYLLINYGPYDRIFEGERFAGIGQEKKPENANYYPQDLSKEEFEKYIKSHPEQKADLESQYTIVVRDGVKLKAIPFHEAYPEVSKLADKLEEAANYCDDKAFKNYLILRAKAIRTDDYYESDMAWMDLKDNDIDIVIGPIENYEDGLYNYKTAYECSLLIKDIEASKELQFFNAHIDDFEQKLPYEKKYIRKSAGGSNNILAIMNVAYFGGDCNKAVKTIASSLPNDPRVTDVKGGKKQMFKNMMEAKFDKIVVPIAKKLLDTSLLPFVDKTAFTSFVTLHEVSHTLGRGFVFGNDTLSVRKSMKELYSAIEETKADILGMYNHKHLLEMKVKDEDYIKRACVTYLAGLYRSIRFGAEAHGMANLIQLNFLRVQGAIKKKDGKLSIDEKIFFDKVGDLARMVLTVEADGDYNAAKKIIEQYGRVTDELSAEIESLKDIPRDLDTKYNY